MKFADSERWIWHPERRAGEPGMVLFRRDFRLERAGVLRIRYSADNRANLFLDGEVIARGPAKSDLENYYLDPVEVPLEPGAHVLEAEVAVYGAGYRSDPTPWSEIRAGGGWLVAGGVYDGEELLCSLSTPGDWRTAVDAGRGWRPWSEAIASDDIFPAPPLEKVDLGRAAADWRKPREIGRPCLKADLKDDPNTRWWLVERPIPALVHEPHPADRVVRASGGAAFRIGASGEVSGRVPAGRSTLLLDMGCYFTGFVRLEWAGGAGSLEIHYAEALYRDGARGRRDDDTGELGGHGYGDRIDFPEGEHRWRSFWYRSGRWIELTFEAAAPLEVTLFELRDWHFPLVPKGIAVPEEYREIEEICRRTALCCAHEHYEDCPYWEQLQYLGDTRIQALISYAYFGEGRLGLQAIRQFGNSMRPEGLTQSRYPSNYCQIIPQFSLFWVLMIDDYHHWFGDAGPVREQWRNLRRVLDYFEDLKLESGLVGPVGYWSITDWVPEWPEGKIDRLSGEPETLITLIYSHCCRRAAELAGPAGHAEEREPLLKRWRDGVAAVNAHCFDAARGYYRDVPGREWFSCHTNAWVILADALPRGEQKAFLKRFAADPEVSRTTLYFAFYLFEAARQCGCPECFYGELGRWNELIELGFTTCPEVPSLATRSDCHAWSASPLYFFALMPQGDR